MGARVLLILVPFLLPAQAGGTLDRALQRLSEEAEVFSQAARRTIGRETLRQRAIVAPSRFRPRIGQSVYKTPPPKWRKREIVSEYGFASFQEAPGALHELRQVVSVDGRPVSKSGEARRVLARGMVSEDDRLKRKLLRDFERYGLQGVASDFGQLILLFTRTGILNYVFTPAGEARIGADRAFVYNFRQAQGQQSLTIFQGRETIRVPLAGTLWVRASDFLPLRILIASERVEDDHRFRDEASVEYFMSSYGCLLPASVVHRQWVNSQPTVENHFSYSGFRRFSADTEIQFETVPEEPKTTQ